MTEWDRFAVEQMQETAERYHQNLLTNAPALLYLETRGITEWLARQYLLGVCDDIRPGWLAIPYLRPAGTIWFNYRDLEPGAKPKYKADGERHLYNTTALDEADRTGEVAICEGELDALLATEVGGLPAVGIPGATQWDQHGRTWRELFSGYQRIWILADPDKSGLELAGKLLESLKQARLVNLPGDVTETILAGHNLQEFLVT